MKEERSLKLIIYLTLSKKYKQYNTVQSNSILQYKTKFYEEGFILLPLITRDQWCRHLSQALSKLDDLHHAVIYPTLSTPCKCVCPPCVCVYLRM